MACCTKKCSLFALLICGGILVITTTVLVIIWPGLYDNFLKNELMLTKKSKSYEMWQETPIPMYLDLYLYNFTNSMEFFNAKNKDGRIKPHFEEKGPYVFKEHHIKVNQTWHSNGTISFLQRRIFQFEPSMSNGSLSDEITNVNVIAFTVGYFLRSKGKFLRLGANSALKVSGEHLTTTRTAGELLFDGYKDKLLEIMEVLDIPDLNIPFDKFGWFYARNMSDTYDGLMSIFTGVNDMNELGKIDLWNLNNRVSYYEGECGAVKGGTGELFAPGLDPDNVTVFATDVCSAITLKRTGDVEIHGVRGSLFIGDESVFDNGWNYPDEKCFCPTNGICQPAGSRNVSLCRSGAPAFVSFPHYYLADPSYLSKIDGLVPNKENDEFRMGLELVTGIPLLVKAQLQINILIQKMPDMSFFDSVPDEIYVPMLWFRQEVKITEEYASQARLALAMPTIGDGVLYSLLAVGICLVLGGLFILVKYPLRRTESHTTLVDDQNGLQ